MALITLLTDFGMQDEYVGVMKGVIAGLNPDATIVDICHRIAPQDIVHGAFILAAAYAYFPAGTVHVAVVDPGVGGRRRILAMEHDAHRFVVPDNGLIEQVLAGGSPSAVVSVEETRYFLASVSHTFHGRDIFAPVAARLAAGLSLSHLGPTVDPASMVSGVIPRCGFCTPTCIEGVVVAADRFGNLMTNIDAASIDRLVQACPGKRMVVELAGRHIGTIATSYDHVPRQSSLAVIGSRGLLEISVNCGSAEEQLTAQIADRVHVHT
ncbi:MAG: SAM-dependent chlorinase/fluorinase [Desulfosarcina sp.]